MGLDHRHLIIDGLGVTWMGAHLGTPGATGMGVDAPYREEDIVNPLHHTASYKALVLLL